MINSISKIESNDVNVFLDDTKRMDTCRYWIKSEPDKVVIKNKKSKLKSSKDISKLIITPEEARKTKNLKIIGLSIAGATVLTAAGIFLLMKGGPKGLVKGFTNLRDFLAKKIMMNKLDKDDAASVTAKVYVYLFNKIEKLLGKFEAVNNFTTFKDLLFKKFMGTNKHMAKAHNKITRSFEKLGRQAVIDRYDKTSNLVINSKNLSAQLLRDAVNGDFDRLVVVNGVSKPVRYWLGRINTLNGEISEIYERGFGKSALRSRYYYFKKATESLKSMFDKIKVFWSRNVYSKFMADSAIMSKKKVVQTQVRKTRNQLTYSLADLRKDTDNSILKLTDLFTFKDREKISRLGAIRTSIKQYVKNPNSGLKQEISSAIETLQTEVKAAIGSGKLNSTNGKQILSELANLQSTFTDFQLGRVEELLAIYKQILPKDDYRLLTKAYSKTIKSLDRSIRTETDDFISKLRDLSMGSAPTDLLSIAGGVGILGYNLAKSDDNDQRMSISLKYGIPALAGIGVMLYCNAKLFAGTKSMLIASGSSFLVNKIGVLADDLRKKYLHKTKKQDEILPQSVQFSQQPKTANISLKPDSSLFLS